MLRWALVFFVLAIVAALYGFGVIAESASMLGRILFILFLLLAVANVIADVAQSQKPQS